MSTRSSRFVWTAAGSAVAAWALFPVAWIVSLSLRVGDGVHSGRFLPAAPSLDNYRTVFATDLFVSALRNSVVVSLGATLLSVTFASLAAYAIVRSELPGKRLLLALSLCTAMFPGVSLIGPLFELWRSVGLYDTWLGLILPYTSFTLPLGIWALTAFFRQLPWELEEAAQIDGATRWQAFRKVMVPLAAPGVLTAAVLVFLFAWNDFLFGISLTSTERSRPVPAALAFFTGASEFQHPTAAIAAAAVLVTLPVVAVALVFQRRITAGLGAGAVKG